MTLFGSCAFEFFCGGEPQRFRGLESVRQLGLPVEFSLETLDHFIDWSRQEPFKVVRGEGECAV